MLALFLSRMIFPKLARSMFELPMLAAEQPRDAKFRENAAWLRKYKPMDFGVEPDVRFTC